MIEDRHYKYLFYLGHPAHYHNARNVAAQLVADGHEVVYIARKKDVLFKLLVDCPHKVHYLEKEKAAGRIGLARFIGYRWRKMDAIVRKERPDILIGTDAVISFVGRLRGVPSVILNEDDLDQVPLLTYGVRLCTASIAPACCRYGDYEHKKVGYKGYQELAYLRPDVFSPDDAVAEAFHPGGGAYFILRFASLNAHHDEGIEGITDRRAEQLIDRLAPHGQVYITSERPLSAALEPYRIGIDPREMHDIMAKAHMYIGDSQTMAAEAAVLGVPSLRFNDFVGRLSYLDELQREYGLTEGFKTTDFDGLLAAVDRHLGDSDPLATMSEKRERMLRETDCTNKVFRATFARILSEAFS